LLALDHGHESKLDDSSFCCRLRSFLWGINAVFPAIIGDYFGRFRAASIIGAIFTIAGSAAAIGPLGGG
jgi:hypothetical protein